jgi:hypothetical protein
MARPALSVEGRTIAFLKSVAVEEHGKVLDMVKAFVGKKPGTATAAAPVTRKKRGAGAAAAAQPADPTPGA